MRHIREVLRLAENLLTHPFGRPRRSGPESLRSTANRDLVDNIRRIHRDTNGRYGNPRIHAELRAQGRGQAAVALERLMRRHGIRAIVARPRTRAHQRKYQWSSSPVLSQRH
ncbi:MAG: transposase [Bradyrhizobium sp.]|nr:IS3 family transposase [Pseudomonadota bacterium]MDE2467996.1 transposase [Bradyrhizobium sp.]